MRAPPRVLVVYKKSNYQLHVLERKDPRLLNLLRRRHPDALDLQEGHEVHRRTLELVVETLKQLPVQVHMVYRADLRSAERYALAISVGGDGTLLRVAHATRNTPVLGVNSDPARSEAVFCAATPTTFERLIRQALDHQLAELHLYRLRARLNGRPLAPLALNDVLIAHEDPATMSRYRLRVGAREERQKSSGLWVATAAGSSSAILAAGGTRLPWHAAQFQYRPRELYQGRLSRSELTGGVLARDGSVEVVSLMRDGLMCIDGPHLRFPLQFGDRISVQLSTTHPLRLLREPATKTKAEPTVG